MTAAALEVALEHGVVRVLCKILELECVVGVLLEVPLVERCPVAQAGQAAFGGFADNLHDANGTGFLVDILVDTRTTRAGVVVVGLRPLNIGNHVAFVVDSAENHDVGVEEGLGYDGHVRRRAEAVARAVY